MMAIGLLCDEQRMRNRIIVLANKRSSACSRVMRLACRIADPANLMRLTNLSSGRCLRRLCNDGGRNLGRQPRYISREGCQRDYPANQAEEKCEQQSQTKNCELPLVAANTKRRYQRDIRQH